VEAIIDATVVEACAGRPEIHYQPGHPHGFSTAIYAGEVRAARPAGPAG
jgi:hypothetical protein